MAKRLIDLNDIELLQRQGWKMYQDSTLKGWKKTDLVDFIRCLEHNWAVSEWGNELLRRRLEKVLNYLHEQGLTIEQTNEILRLEEENI